MAPSFEDFKNSKMIIVETQGALKAVPYANYVDPIQNELAVINSRRAEFLRIGGPGAGSDWSDDEAQRLYTVTYGEKLTQRGGESNPYSDRHAINESELRALERAQHTRKQKFEKDLRVIEEAIKREYKGLFGCLPKMGERLISERQEAHTSGSQSRGGIL